MRTKFQSSQKNTIVLLTLIVIILEVTVVSFLLLPIVEAVSTMCLCTLALLAIFIGIKFINMLMKEQTIGIDKKQITEDVKLTLKGGIPISVNYFISLKSGQALFRDDIKINGNVIDLKTYIEANLISVRDSVYRDRSSGASYFYNQSSQTITPFADSTLDLKGYRTGYAIKYSNSKIVLHVIKEFLHIKHKSISQ